MYIAITRKKYKDTYHEQILIRESYREDGKVKTRTIANLTGRPQKQVDAIVAALKYSDEPTITTKNCKKRSHLDTHNGFTWTLKTETLGQ